MSELSKTLKISSDTHQKLSEYKAIHRLSSFDDCIDKLLDGEKQK